MKKSDILDGKLPRRRSKNEFSLGFKLRWSSRERVVPVRSLSEWLDTGLMCSPSGVQRYRLVPPMYLAASGSRFMI